MITYIENTYVNDSEHKKDIGYIGKCWHCDTPIYEGMRGINSDECGLFCDCDCLKAHYLEELEEDEASGECWTCGCEIEPSKVEAYKDRETGIYYCDVVCFMKDYYLEYGILFNTEEE